MSTEREWKPGDVAMLNDFEIGICRRAGVIGRGRNEGAHWMTEGGELWSSIRTARPLVVIDPEDREQVERLIRLFCGHTPNGDAEYVISKGGINNMQAALRNLIEPPKPPKPEEPTGLGAVVEDSTGQLWVRHEQTALAYMHWHRVGGNSVAKWLGIDAVKILSEGVPS